MKVKVGFGYDVHQLTTGLPLRVGGVDIPHSKGALGHSDADVLIHAICDALLGAANLRDIGVHFPNTDPLLKGVDSTLLLDKTHTLIAEKGFKIGNIDSTIALQRPKISGFIPLMQQRLSEVLGIDTDDISIKATTTEKLGFEGREEGVSAYAVVLIYKD